jgi:hypothetical protein
MLVLREGGEHYVVRSFLVCILTQVTVIRWERHVAREGDRNVDTIVTGKSKMLALRKRAFAYRRAGPQECDLLFDAKLRNWEVFRGKWFVYRVLLMNLNGKLLSLAAWNLRTFRQFVPHREQSPCPLHRPSG